MGASKTLFIAMQEQEYMDIPAHIRESHLASKIYRQSPNDFDELMKDDTYARLYKEKKHVTKELDKREYDLREQNRRRDEK